MDCEEVLLKLNEYIDEELDQKTYKEIYIHLLSCDSCRKEFEELILIKKTIKQECYYEPSDEFCDKLTNMFHNVKVQDNEDNIIYNNKFVFCLICIVIFVIVILSNMDYSESKEINNIDGQNVVVQFVSDYK